MSKIMFNSEVELGKFLRSIDVIAEAYGAISETNLLYELHTTRSGNNVLAFNCSSDDTTQLPKKELDLLPSENPHVLDFISTKVNPKFSINKTAIELFQGLSDDVKEKENEHKNTPLIITGSGLGGYLAILSTLRLHHAIDVEESNGSRKTKRPICITFGTPLVGDANLQKAITERPKWKSSFLNVVAKNDPLASFFSSNTDYKPFGTFLFCIESGGVAAFEDQGSIMLVLDAMKPSGNFQVYDYTNILSLIRKKVLYRGVSVPNEFNLNPMRAGITLQLKEIDVLDILNVKIGEMEKKQSALIRKKNMANAYDPTKKLNDSKISLTFMEWYMNDRKTQRCYYDRYRYAETKQEIEKKQEIVIHQGRLNVYWKKFVEDKDQMPQKDGVNLRKRWLYSGNNYRRIVEPLDIAEYYKKEGQKDYMKNRPNHYKLLEKWLDEDKKESKSREEKRSKAASLTEDSCFFAHVEEAMISLRDLKNGGSNDIEKELEKFEGYVMCEIKKYALSPDVFLDGSSLMKWWDVYKAHKGNAYASEFAAYMNNGSYRSYN